MQKMRKYMDSSVTDAGPDTNTRQQRQAQVCMTMTWLVRARPL